MFRLGFYMSSLQELCANWVMSGAPGRSAPGSPRTYHARIPWQQTTSHPTEAQRYRADINDKYSHGILYTMECHITPPPPSTNVLQKLVTFPRNTLSTVTGTSTHRGSSTKDYYRPGTQPHTNKPNNYIHRSDLLHNNMQIYERTRKTWPLKLQNCQKLLHYATVIWNVLTEYHLDNVWVRIYISTVALEVVTVHHCGASGKQSSQAMQELHEETGIGPGNTGPLVGRHRPIAAM